MSIAFCLRYTPLNELYPLSVERQFEVRDLALARLEGEKERGGEVQVRYSDFLDFGDILPEQFL